jgi:hypothetical protein
MLRGVIVEGWFGEMVFWVGSPFLIDLGEGWAFRRRLERLLRDCEGGGYKRRGGWITFVFISFIFAIEPSTFKSTYTTSTPCHNTKPTPPGIRPKG